MASPFQQRSLQRKFIYFGLIVALFTGSLLFRRLVINTQAAELRLRSEDQGEVALTDTALRLSLGGLRGVAVTSLWLTAIERQKKHEWSELEAAVRSLTQLQPHYTSPWLFQSWNLAFNVSVECDRTRDKYFYISRGIELLAEGERKNRGNEHPDPALRSPANPEMRFHIGFTYQLKIGQGDEKRTLRSLFDLSCIDPNKRRPEALWVAGSEGQQVDLARFRDFCAAQPRLVRRLREQLGLERPDDVVNFLADNRDVPSRFQKPEDENAQPRLLPAIDQFPVLPPRKKDVWPDPSDVNFGGVETDVFMVTRAWYDYAQEPLPKPTGEPGVEPEAVPGRDRLPRMSQYIFRTYPARAQAFVAEELEKEGWFDGKGWRITRWFDELPDQGPEQNVVVGRNRFNGADAWDKAYQLYREYGRENGLYAPAEWAKLELQANLKGPRSAEARLVQWMGIMLGMTNYHAQVLQADAERDDKTAAARRKFYQAERLQQENNIRALNVYREALHDWVDVLLAFPAFAREGHVQEDTYEAELTYLRLLQRRRQAQLEPLVKQLAASVWPEGFVDRLLTYGREKRVAMKRIIPTRNVFGPLDLVYVYRGTGTLNPEVGRTEKQQMAALTLALTQLGLWPPARIDEQLLDARQRRRLLTAERWRGDPPGRDWSPLIEDATIRTVRERLGIGADLLKR